MRDGAGSGGREAGMVMLFMKRTKNEYLPDYIEYKKIIFYVRVKLPRIKCAKRNFWGQGRYLGIMALRHFMYDL